MQDNHTSENFMRQFSRQADVCLDKLNVMQQTVVKKNWEHLEKHTGTYTSEINKLEIISTNYGALPKTCYASFQYLLQQQHRVMRLIHDAQQQTQENINAASHGLRKTEKLSLMLKNNQPIVS